MRAIDREPHLKGKAHRTHIPVTVVSPPSTEFFCITCQKFMHIGCKNSHMIGKKHRTKLKECVSNTFVRDPIRLHLDGKAHQAKQDSAIVNFGLERPPQNRKTRTRGGEKPNPSLQKAKAPSHLKRHLPPRRVVPRYKKSQVAFKLGKRLHPNGKRYIKICAVRSVYRHSYNIPLAAYGWVRPSTFVTPETVEGASDVVASQWLRHTIGVSWRIHGRMTYKYSDFYELKYRDFFKFQRVSLFSSY